ncbi:hypothetical protein ACA910_015796 [Epithemia clementina (nom. ined.)]
MEVITLSCGHKWHLQCVREQLEHAQPSPSQRLLFTGCTCAKCGQFCDHPKLQHLTRQTDSLRQQVHEMIVEQLKIDAPTVWKKYQGSSNTKNNNNNDQGDAFKALMEYGQRTYAFYLCAGCRQPYFGGTVECADQQQELEETSEAAHRRLCVACAAPHQPICRQPLQHRGQLIWKCRYCCQPSQFICHANIHFCVSCHDRYSQRRTQMQRERQENNSSARRRGTLAPLEAIPCPGGSACPFPKPTSSPDRHKNGPSLDCEQVYQCVCCATEDDNDDDARSSNTVKSHNLLINPNGALGLQGWVPHQNLSSSSWHVEPSELPLVLPRADAQDHAGIITTMVTNNFVSSFHWCIMSQRVRLHQVVRDPSRVRLEFSAYIMARTDCPSEFQMEALILGPPPPQPRQGRRGEVQSPQQEVLHFQSTPVLNAPADSWERVSLIVEAAQMTTRAYEAVMVLHGKDSRFWAGNYGSKVTACSVRILADTEEELQTQLLVGEVAAAAPGVNPPLQQQPQRQPRPQLRLLEHRNLRNLRRRRFLHNDEAHDDNNNNNANINNDNYFAGRPANRPAAQAEDVEERNNAGNSLAALGLLVAVLLWIAANMVS